MVTGERERSNLAFYRTKFKGGFVKRYRFAKKRHLTILKRRSKRVMRIKTGFPVNIHDIISSRMSSKMQRRIHKASVGRYSCKWSRKLWRRWWSRQCMKLNVYDKHVKTHVRRVYDANQPSPDLIWPLKPNVSNIITVEEPNRSKKLKIASFNLTSFRTSTSRTELGLLGLCLLVTTTSTW